MQECLETKLQIMIHQKVKVRVVNQYIKLETQTINNKNNKYYTIKNNLLTYVLNLIEKFEMPFLIVF